jgi:hypothetical protein
LHKLATCTAQNMKSSPYWIRFHCLCAHICPEFHIIFAETRCESDARLLSHRFELKYSEIPGIGYPVHFSRPLGYGAIYTMRIMNDSEP